MGTNEDGYFTSNEEGPIKVVEFSHPRRNKNMGSEAIRAFRKEMREAQNENRNKAKRVLVGVAEAAVAAALVFGVVKLGDEGIGMRTPENQKQWEETMKELLSDKNDPETYYNENGSMITYDSPDNKWHYKMLDPNNDLIIEAGSVTIDGGKTVSFEDPKGVMINNAEKRLNIAANSN